MLASSNTFSSWPLVAPDYSDSINWRKIRSTRSETGLCSLTFINRTHQIVVYDIGYVFKPIGSFDVDCLAHRGRVGAFADFPEFVASQSILNIGAYAVYVQDIF